MKIVVLGGDTRMVYAGEEFGKRGHTVSLLSSACATALGREESLPLARAELYLLPMPLTKDKRTLYAPKGPALLLAEIPHPAGAVYAGGGPSPFQGDRPYFNYAADPDLIEGNSRLSARGALAELGNLAGIVQILVLGYGALGRALAEEAGVAGYSVTVAARREASRKEAMARGYPAIRIGELPQSKMPTIVYNTVPSPILGTEFFKSLPAFSRYFELASLPGGICPDADCGGIPVHNLPGIPGKYAPREAGFLIYKTVARHLGL